MYWNHRVISRVDGAGTDFEETNLYVTEMYYHEDGSVIGWTEGKEVYGNDIAEIRQTLEWMLLALDKPILDEAQLLIEAEEARETGEEDIFPGERLTLDEVLDSLGLEREDLADVVDHKENTPESPSDFKGVADATPYSKDLGL